MSSLRRTRLALHLAVSGLGLLACGTVPALADTPAPQTPEAAAPKAASSDTIVVTGTRLRRQDYSTASPIVSFGATQLQQAGTVNLTDFLTSLPALNNSSTSYQNSGDRANIGTTGLNLLNLRNLGTDRTLVLVDGRRHVSGLEGSQSVDINTIPEDLVERVDVLTGGASAIYGADGVTGVVNFALKKNFEGFTARMQSGISGQGDASNRLIALTWGKNFAGGRGNIALAYEYGGEDELRTHDRAEFSGRDSVSFLYNPDYDDSHRTPGVYYRVPIAGASYAWTSRKGAVDVNFDGQPDYNGLGQPYNLGTALPNGYSVNSEDTLVSDYGNDLRPRIDRHVFNLIGHFDFSPAFKLYAEAKYANILSYSLAQPTFDYNLFIPSDNPYIPSTIQSAIDPANGGVLVTRDNFDLGQRGERIKRETWRSVIGAKGDLGNNLSYDVSYVFGQTNVTNHFINDRYTDRWNAAIDAVTNPKTGKPDCRVNVDPTDSAAALTFSPGECVPFNVFGEGVSSQAALDFIHAQTTEHSRLVQHVATASLSGDTHGFLTLPGGPIGFVVGTEFRYEASTFTPDILEQQGLTFSNLLRPSHGSYSVKEAFGELDLPLLRDRPFIKMLDISGAVRVANYTTTGTSTTWKFDGKWAPVSDIQFRGTLSRSVRSPNIGELFGAQSQTYAFFDDPCTVNNRTLGKPSRAANCQAILSQAGLDSEAIANFTDTRSTNIAGVQGGNPNLKPEVANTWTAGVVLQPSFVPGLALSFDWYSIKLKQAINTVDPQLLAELCVDQPSIDNVFCGSITRAQGTGLISTFTIQPENVASFQTSGLDFNLNYGHAVKHLGTLSLKIVGNYLNKLKTVGTPGADPTDEIEQYAYNSPKYQFYTNLGLATGKLTLDYSWSWFSKVRRYSPDKTNANANYVAPQYLWVKPHSVHNIFASVDVTKAFQWYGGITNLFNQKPDLGYIAFPTEAIGRAFYTGIKVKF